MENIRNSKRAPRLQVHAAATVECAEAVYISNGESVSGTDNDLVSRRSLEQITVLFHSIRIVTVTGPSDERNFGARHRSPPRSSNFAHGRLRVSGRGALTRARNRPQSVEIPPHVTAHQGSCRKLKPKFPCHMSQGLSN